MANRQPIIFLLCYFGYIANILSLSLMAALSEVFDRNVGTHSMWMPGVGKDKDADLQTLVFTSMDPDQIKEVRLSIIVALGKGAGLLNSPV